MNAATSASEGAENGFFFSSKLLGKFEDGCWIRRLEGSSVFGTTRSYICQPAISGTAIMTTRRGILPKPPAMNFQMGAMNSSMPSSENVTIRNRAIMVSTM